MGGRAFRPRGTVENNFHSDKSKKTIEINISTLATIEKGSNFPEIWRLDSKESNVFVRVIDTCWPCRCPRLLEARADDGTEFNSSEFQ